MAHKVMGPDMAALIHAMKLAVQYQYSSTILDTEYRKGMLQAAHVLAFDSRNLLDAVDNARKRQVYQQHQPRTCADLQIQSCSLDYQRQATILDSQQ